MGFEMVARLSCEANHQNSCITKHILHHSNPTIQKPKGKCHASRHTSHSVTFCSGFSFMKGVEIHPPVMGKEGGSPVLLQERCVLFGLFLFLNRALEKIKFSGSNVSISVARRTVA